MPPSWLQQVGTVVSDAAGETANVMQGEAQLGSQIEALISENVKSLKSE